VKQVLGFRGLLWLISPLPLMSIAASV